MRYPSLSNVHLIVIDGRQWNARLGVFLRGALLALLDHLAYHVLVVTSRDKHAEKVEQMGEASGMGMYFHGEPIQTDADFLNRCGYADIILIPNGRPTLDIEITALLALEKHLLLSNGLTVKSLANTERILYVDGSSSMNICNKLKNASLPA
jgi:hypothetical protein